jgi:hypothetical protein
MVRRWDFDKISSTRIIVRRPQAACFARFYASWAGAAMASLKDMTSTFSDAAGPRRYVLPSLALATGAFIDFVMLRYGLSMPRVRKLLLVLVALRRCGARHSIGKTVRDEGFALGHRRSEPRSSVMERASIR